MSRLEKFLLGGVGALIPILSTIAIADADKIVEYVDSSAWEVAGYLARAAGIFLLGAIWVYADGSIVTRRKAIEIGLAAPALVSVWLSTANLEVARKPGNDVAGFQIISSAYAEEKPDDRKPERPGPLQQFIKGVLGR